MRAIRPTDATGMLACAALVAGLAMGSMSAARADVQPGKAAPDFTVRDTSGKDVKLSGYRGKIVVIEWTNHLCPYTVKHYATDNMQALQRDATKDGVVWLTIVSSAPGTQGHVNELEAEKLTADRKAAPTAFLLDPDGKVAHLYQAKTTPHMFVIDKNGAVAYMGAIDDKPTASHGDVKGATNYVRDALAAVQAGQAVKTASTRPYGCTVKYSAARS
jgi:peroxiredoxin